MPVPSQLSKRDTIAAATNFIFKPLQPPAGLNVDPAEATSL